MEIEAVNDHNNIVEIHIMDKAARTGLIMIVTEFFHKSKPETLKI